MSSYRRKCRLPRILSACHKSVASVSLCHQLVVAGTSVSWHTVPHVEWAERYPRERLAPPDQRWASRYTQMASTLTAALEGEWLTEHVGSTSVPGLLAKPVIGIALRTPQGTVPTSSRQSSPKQAGRRPQSWETTGQRSSCLTGYEPVSDTSSRSRTGHKPTSGCSPAGYGTELTHPC